MTWCKTLCNDFRGAIRGSPMFQVVIAALILILSGLIAVGVYTLVREPTNVIAYIMLGVCGICILFIFGVAICILGCYPAPAVSSVVTVQTTATAPTIPERSRGSNPMYL